MATLPERSPHFPVAEPQAVEVRQPARLTAAAVFASPHSGADYPADFVSASRLGPTELRRSEDAFVDELFSAAPRLGAPLLRALFPRAYVDPNREAWELDPAMFAGPLPDYVNTASLRVRAGLGTIARFVATGSEIYREKLEFGEVRERIERFYKPYHRTLTATLDESFARFGRVLLIDCHSMPSIGGPMERDAGRRRVDFVLGDCHGASASPIVMETIAAQLTQAGFVVARNDPYAGGFTTRHYGRPVEGRHAFQIEINRALYMDEQHITRRPDFPRVVAAMTALQDVIIELARRL